ncbi:MAG: iron-containing redox enzyme family protein [Thermoplasmata archaeon]|nr:iron-containing redox enzyme family protein [Thermoplasmata archaeon]MCI4359485.1 iron-containing redox enzyme family protein [Thermoplasmata archaeon]
MPEAPWVRYEGEAFRRELTRFKMENHPFRTHRFFRDLESGAAPRETVFRWATQFYPWLACVPIAMAERFARTSWQAANDRFRIMILDQLVEEAGDPKGKEPGHPELWLRFCEGLGLPRDKVLGAPLLPSTLVAIDDFLYINREMPFYISAAGSSEPPNVELCRRLLPAFREHYGVDESHLAYYSLHVTADEEHTRFVGEMVEAFANDPTVRHQMWDAMLRGFALHGLLVDGAIAPGGAA